MLVGRRREIALLVERIAGNRPVVVVGEPGIGKTALLRAAADAAGRRAREGGGLATLSWMAYLPLERALGLRPLEGDATHVASLVAAEIRDDVLLLDDVHWADVGTLRVLELLAGRTRVVAAARRGDPGASSALAALAEADFELLPLERLSDGEAIELVHTRRPGLSNAVAARIVERARGNPLLLEELTVEGEASETLKLSLAGRLRQLSPDAREAMALFAVAGRPIAGDGAGRALSELVESGLVEQREGLYETRHSLMAEVIEADLSAEERRAAHSVLARETKDDGTAARHHAEAAELAEAYKKALRAAATATRPGERAAHLALAADVSPADASSEHLLLRAAAALTEGYQPEQARRILDRLTAADPAVQAEAALLRWRTMWDLHESPADLQRCVEAGFAAAAGTHTEAEVRLRVVDARTAGTYGGDHDVFRAKAESALALAVQVGVAEGYAHSVLGSALMFRAEDEWEHHVSTAIEFASRDGDVLGEFTATNTFVYGNYLAGDPRTALGAAEAGIDRAKRLRLGSWERRFRVWKVALLWAMGDIRQARELADELLLERLPPGDLDIVEPYTCQVLVDLGLVEDARRLLERLRARAAPDQESLGELLWATADLELWCGRPREALDAAEEYVERFAGFNVSETPRFVELSRAWAGLELGLAPPQPEFGQRYALTRGSEPELSAIAALTRDDSFTAARLFHDAALEWSGRNARSALRCAWAEGAALHRAGDDDAARVLLEQVEQDARDSGFAVIVARAERSLRQTGARRATERAPAGELSSREEEILALVCHGLSNIQIARRLGLSAATVAEHLASASDKLGARNRAQAAALYAQL